MSNNGIFGQNAPLYELMTGETPNIQICSYDKGNSSNNKCSSTGLDSPNCCNCRLSNDWWKSKDINRTNKSDNQYFSFGYVSADKYPIATNLFTNVTNLQNLIDIFGRNPNVLQTKFYFKLSGEWNGADYSTYKLTAWTYNGYTPSTPESFGTTYYDQIDVVSLTSAKLVNTNTIMTGLNITNFDRIRNPPTILFALCSGGCGDCDYGMKNIKIRMFAEIKINIKNFCALGSNFELPDCQTYCSFDDKDQDCIDIANDYCFKDRSIDGTGDGYGILDDNSFCPSFIKKYLRTKGNTVLDKKIQDLCISNNINPENYDQSGNEKFNDLCACHFDDSVYTNYYNSLLQKVPNLNLSGQVSSYCIFPFCNVSNYKPVSIAGTNVCPTLQCIQGITINNNGNINGDVTLNQSAQCINYLTKGSSTSPPSPVTKICVNDSDCDSNQECNPKTKVCQPKSSGISIWVWIVIGLGVLAIFFIIFFVVVIKKNKKPNLSK
jgi:hypothetical protein